MKKRLLFSIIALIFLLIIPSFANALTISHHVDWVNHTLEIDIDEANMVAISGFTVFDNGTDVTNNSTLYLLNGDAVNLDVVYAPVYGWHNVTVLLDYSSETDNSILTNFYIMFLHPINKTIIDTDIDIDIDINNGTGTITLPFDIFGGVIGFLSITSIIALVRLRKK